MDGKDALEALNDHELLELVVRSGNYQAAASTCNMTRDSFNRYLSRRGVKAQCDEALSSSVRSDPDSRLEVDDPQRIAIDQHKAEIRMLRRENAKYAEMLAEQEKFFDRIVEATRVPTDVPDFVQAERDDKLPHRSVICPVYDQQYGQFVRPTDTPGNRGKFDVAEFDRRLVRWVEGVTGSIRDYAQSHAIDELIIPLGGDHVEGDDIYAGMPWQLEVDPVRQVWDLSNKMYSAIDELVAFAKDEIGVPKIGLYGVTGNHGKVGGKRGGARPATYNWDWLFQMMLRDKLRDHPIDQFEIEPGGSLLFACADHIFLTVHGDEIRGWGGLPFYGLTRFDGRAMRLHRVLFDYLLMGHHHQPAEIPNGSGEQIVSGDWVGANNLSRMISAASRPQQKILYVARKWGLVETSKIYFAESDEAYEPTVVHGVSN